MIDYERFTPILVCNLPKHEKAMTQDILLPSLWDDAVAAALDEPGKLLYRSNLLGSDLRITNFGGGNTSAKLSETDPLTGAPVDVLWVKGSGGDIGSMKLDGFSTLYQDKLLGLEERPSEKLTRELAESWRPHRGAAAIFTWHCYNNPVL